MEQESKSMEIQRYRVLAVGFSCQQAIKSHIGPYVLYADHAAALKAAQDAIAVEKRALLAANAELAKDTERMRVMREALEKLARLGNGDCYGNSDGNMIARAALASTAPVAAKEDA